MLKLFGFVVLTWLVVGLGAAWRDGWRPLWLSRWRWRRAVQQRRRSLQPKEARHRVPLAVRNLVRARRVS
jgi:hypothetical protein